MADVLLDSSVVIGLVFRHAGERHACAAAFPADSNLLCSNYVIFEIARGFLRRLIALHNTSFEFRKVADLQVAATSGQRRFTYEMPTWIGAVTDYLAELEAEDGNSKSDVSLEEFRAKLRGWIRRGWKQLHTKFHTINEVGCRNDIPPPFQKLNQLLDQALPDSECGTPSACKLQIFVHSRPLEIASVVASLKALPKSKLDAETAKRIEGLNHLLSKAEMEPFEGKQCHRCGDAIICMEAPPDAQIATKNVKHFEPIAESLGKRLLAVKSATSTEPNA